MTVDLQFAVNFSIMHVHMKIHKEIHTDELISFVYALIYSHGSIIRHFMTFVLYFFYLSPSL